FWSEPQEDSGTQVFTRLESADGGVLDGPRLIAEGAQYSVRCLAVADPEGFTTWVADATGNTLRRYRLDGGSLTAALPSSFSPTGLTPFAGGVFVASTATFMGETSLGVVVAHDGGVSQAVALSDAGSLISIVDTPDGLVAVL